VLGDSFGDAMFPGIALIGEKYGLSIRQATHCATLMGVERTSSCREFNEKIVRQIQDEPTMRLAILIGRWSDFPTEELLQGLSKTLDTFKALGLRVLIVGEPPNFRSDPNRCHVRASMYGENRERCFRLRRAFADKQLNSYKGALTRLTRDRPWATYLDVASILCDEKFCWARKGDIPIYRNNDHLSLAGAEFISKSLVQDSKLSSLMVELKGVAAADPVLPKSSLP
jgi:hypothetical protein